MDDKNMIDAVFWGLEVKPGAPTRYKAAGKTIWITQATLGTGDDTERCAIECKVGKRGPVLLCAFTPNKVETQRLKMRFREMQNIVFSVAGNRSVHLAGYYYYNNFLNIHLSDEEYFGIDIQNTESDSDESKYDHNQYGGSFIDDSELSPGKDKAKEKKRSSEQLDKGKRIMPWKSKYSDNEDSDDLLSGFKKSKYC